MVQPDQQVLECVMRFRHELGPLIGWLKARREQARDRLEAGNNPVDSGRGLELKDILNLFEEAPAILEKMRSREASVVKRVADRESGPAYR